MRKESILQHVFLLRRQLSGRTTLLQKGYEGRGAPSNTSGWTNDCGIIWNADEKRERIHALLLLMDCPADQPIAAVSALYLACLLAIARAELMLTSIYRDRGKWRMMRNGRWHCVGL